MSVPCEMYPKSAADMLDSNASPMLVGDVRWATAGPFESYHLGGGPGGIRHLLEHLGPGMARRWKDLGQPELTPELVDQVSSDTEARFADAPYDARTAERDRLQLAVLAAREAARRDG